jgi:hypothetical protein
MKAEVTQVLTQIALLLVSLFVTLVSAYIKKRWSAEKVSAAIEKTKVFVRAAEMVGATLGYSGAEKKEWVLGKVSELIHVDRATLDDFVEAAVTELKAAREELQSVNGQVLAKFPQ